MTLAGLSPAGALIVRAGEPFALQVGYVDENGDLQDLTGRLFTLAVRYTDQTVPFLTIDAELDGLAVTAVALGTAEQASQIYAAGLTRSLSYDFMELTSGATASRLTERVSVQSGSDIPGNVIPQYMDLPLLSVTVAAQRKLVVERGRPGFGAERRLFDAGLIDEPTTEKMDARYLQAGAEGARPFADAAEAARDIAVEKSESAQLSAQIASTDADRAEFAASSAEAFHADMSSNGQNTILYGPLDIHEEGSIGAALSEALLSPVAMGAKGDGVTNDTLVLLGAMQSGRDIFLPKDKTFLVSAGTVLVPAKGQRIIGPGQLKKIAIGTGGEQFIRIINDDVVVDGVTFNDARSSGGRSYAVTIEGCKGARVLNCNFTGYETPIFVWKNSSNYRILSNTMRGGDFGVAIGGDADGNTNGAVKDGVIAFNTIENMRSEAVDINWDVEGCVVAMNTFKNNNLRDHEEDVDIGGGVCRDIKILYNIADGGGNSAHFVSLKHDTRDVIISGNSAKNYTEGAVFCFEEAVLQNCAILDNSFNGDGSTGKGIVLRHVTGFNIRGNSVTGFFDDGILAFATCSGGFIVGNTVKDGGDDGIVCLAPDTTISGNSVHDNAEHGINGQAPRLTITENQIYNNGKGTPGRYGLVLSAGSDGSVITSNRIYDSQDVKSQNGFLATGACSGCIFSSNLISGNIADVAGLNLLTNSRVTTGWVPYVPAVNPGTGGPYASHTVQAYYRLSEGEVRVKFVATIPDGANNGGATDVRIALPAGFGPIMASSEGSGREVASTGQSLSFTIASPGNSVAIRDDDNNYPGGPSGDRTYQGGFCYLYSLGP